MKKNASDSALTSTMKTKWTPDEDNLLKKTIAKCGTKNWSLVANFVAGRTGKQCRERWLNQLSPELNKEHWGQHEDALLIHFQNLYGNSWSKIMQFLPGRSANSIKNRWSFLLRHRALQTQASFLSHAQPNIPSNLRASKILQHSIKNSHKAHHLNIQQQQPIQTPPLPPLQQQEDVDSIQKFLNMFSNNNCKNNFKLSNSPNETIENKYGSGDGSEEGSPYSNQMQLSPPPTLQVLTTTNSTNIIPFNAMKIPIYVPQKPLQAFIPMQAHCNCIYPGLASMQQLTAIGRI